MEIEAKTAALRELNHALSLSKGAQAALEKSVASLRDEMEAKAKAAAENEKAIAGLKEELATAQKEYVEDVKKLGEAVKLLQSAPAAAAEEEGMPA